MKKYRFKTKEEFISDDLWLEDEYCDHDDKGYPQEWCEDGDMNKYLGEEIPNKFSEMIEKGHGFDMAGWSFRIDDVIEIESEINIEETLEQVKQLNKNSLKTKKEIIIEKSKIYREKNKKEISDRKKEYRLANLEVMRAKSNNYYKNNKQKSLEKNKDYRKNNPEKMRELAKKDYERSSQNLTDRYVRNIMKRHYGSLKEIPQEIIELKRIIIKTHRLCQQLQN